MLGVSEQNTSALP